MLGVFLSKLSVTICRRLRQLPTKLINHAGPVLCCPLLGLGKYSKQKLCTTMFLSLNWFQALGVNAQFWNPYRGAQQGQQQNIRYGGYGGFYGSPYQNALQQQQQQELGGYGGLLQQQQQQQLRGGGGYGYGYGYNPYGLEQQQQQQQLSGLVDELEQQQQQQQGLEY